MCSYVFRRVCTVCEFYTKKTKFTLRGLCRDSRHDRKFTLETNGVAKPFFKGLSTSIIKWVSFWRFLAILAPFGQLLSKAKYLSVNLLWKGSFQRILGLDDCLHQSLNVFNKICFGGPIGYLLALLSSFGKGFQSENLLWKQMNFYFFTTPKLLSELTKLRKIRFV